MRRSGAGMRGREGRARGARGRWGPPGACAASLARRGRAPGGGRGGSTSAALQKPVGETSSWSRTAGETLWAGEKIFWAGEKIFWTGESRGRNLARGSVGTSETARQSWELYPSFGGNPRRLPLWECGEVAHLMSPSSPSLRYSRGTYPRPKFFSLCILAPTPPSLGPRKCRRWRGAGVRRSAREPPRPRFRSEPPPRLF